MVTPPRTDLQTCLHTEEMFQGGWPFIYKTQKPKNPKWHRPWDDLWGAYQDRHGLCHFGFWGKTQKPKNPKLHTTKKKSEILWEGPLKMKTKKPGKTKKTKNQNCTDHG